MAKFLMPVVSLFMVLGFLSSAHATNLFVTSPSTGSAIHGFDPVAYFDKHAAILGVDGFELEWGNAYWKFINAANKERFEESPHIYIPQFNGYGAYSVAEGRLAEGNPHIWVIYENKLLFFYSINARQAWMDNPVKFTKIGKENWKKLRATLAR